MCQTLTHGGGLKMVLLTLDDDPAEAIEKINSHKNDGSVGQPVEKGGIATGAVTSEKLADGAVTGVKIAEKAITAEKLSDDLKELVEKAGGGGDGALGWCTHRRIECEILADSSKEQVKLYWRDPEDTTASWAKTVIVKKKGSYPASITDGTVVAVVNVRDKHKQLPLTDTNETAGEWMYKAFPTSSSGGISTHELNKFGYWLYGYTVNKNDAVESTCVHKIPNTDNFNYKPLKMVFAADVADNALDWGDWEDAPFMPKPCALKHRGVVDYYLDKNDYNLKEDGSPNNNISNTSYDGEMMMEWGKIFVKVVNELNSYSVYFCSEKLDDDFECYSCIKQDGSYEEHFYTPIYEGLVVSGQMRSLSTGTDGTGTGAVKRTASTNMTQEMSYAKANGTGWNIETWADTDLINCLGVLVTNRLNFAMSIGYSCGSGSGLTHNIGTSNKKGMFFGHYTTSTFATKFFGMENWYGHCWRRVVGLLTNNYEVLVKMAKNTGDGSTTENYNTTGEGYINTGMKVPAMSGSYIMDVHASKYGITIPKTITKYVGDATTATGTSTTWYCDGGYSAGGLMALIRGGAVDAGAVSGPFAFNVDNAPGYANWGVGAALSYHPA